jgi:hypothetical protein
LSLGPRRGRLHDRRLARHWSGFVVNYFVRLIPIIRSVFLSQPYLPVEEDGSALDREQVLWLDSIWRLAAMKHADVFQVSTIEQRRDDRL